MSPAVLAFDTSGPYCAAALLIGEKVLVRQEDMPRGQAERLMPFLDDLLAEAQTDWRSLDALGVCTGPGNFTGIRISVAAARGLALGLGCPAIGVSALEALAFGRDKALTAVSAPRGHVYVQAFRDGYAQSEARLIDPQTEAAPLSLQSVPLVGAVSPVWGTSPTAPACAPVEAIARLAAARCRADDPEPPAPLYIKPPDAAPARDAPPVILDA